MKYQNIKFWTFRIKRGVKTGVLEDATFATFDMSGYCFDLYTRVYTCSESMEPIADNLSLKVV